MFGPEWTYHVVVENTTDWSTMQEWCNAYVGEFDQDWYKLGVDPLDYVLNDRFRTEWYFKREQDAVLFKLKWT